MVSLRLVDWGWCALGLNMHVMKIRTSTFLVPFAFCAIGCCALVFQGCKKEPAKPVPPPSSPESYMNDPEFRGRLAKERGEHVKLVRESNAISAKMKAKIDALREKMKTEDPAKLKVELEKDPEWVELYTQKTNANARVEAHRKATLGVVRERLTPKREISK